MNTIYTAVFRWSRDGLTESEDAVGILQQKVILISHDYENSIVQWQEVKVKGFPVSIS